MDNDAIERQHLLGEFLAAETIGKTATVYAEKLFAAPTLQHSSRHILALP